MTSKPILIFRNGPQREIPKQQSWNHPVNYQAFLEVCICVHRKVSNKFVQTFSNIQRLPNSSEDLQRVSPRMRNLLYLIILPNISFSKHKPFPKTKNTPPTTKMTTPKPPTPAYKVYHPEHLPYYTRTGNDPIDYASAATINEHATVGLAHWEGHTPSLRRSIIDGLMCCLEQ